jgi:hypothetical protein
LVVLYIQAPVPYTQNNHAPHVSVNLLRPSQYDAQRVHLLPRETDACVIEALGFVTRLPVQRVHISALDRNGLGDRVEHAKGQRSVPESHEPAYALVNIRYAYRDTDATDQAFANPEGTLFRWDAFKNGPRSN